MCAILRKMHKCVRHTVPRWAVLRLGATPNRRSGGTGMTTMIVWNGPMLNYASCHGDMSHDYHKSARSMPYHDALTPEFNDERVH